MTDLFDNPMGLMGFEFVEFASPVPGVLDLLARVYWYTVEFGLVQQKDGLRLYGAGIVSSYTESIFALDDASPNRVRFDLPRVMQTDYRIDDFQETYFVIRDLDELLATNDEFLLGKWLEDAKRWGATDSERAKLEWNARRILTLWGQVRRFGTMRGRNGPVC